MAKEKLETTYYRFLSEIKAFLASLLKNPISAKPHKYLVDRNFNKTKLINVLIKRDILERHEKILDPTNSDEKVAKYTVKYKVRKKDFEKRIHRIFTQYFEENLPKKEDKKEDINEEKKKKDKKETQHITMPLISRPIYGGIGESKGKNVFITEKQASLIREAMDFQFSFEELMSISNLADRIKYCKTHLGPSIGMGSSRLCFQIDDEKLLKLAMNRKGLEQNKKEGTPDYYLESLGIVPKVYHNLSDFENGTYLVSEYVLPAEENDFNECFGVPFNLVCKFLRTSYNLHYDFRFKFSYLSRDEFQKLIDKNDFFATFDEYIGSYSVDPVMINDMGNIDNWGLTKRNGKPTMVLLDNGIDMDIFKNFYIKQYN